ncbi:M24 family metallopeptidase [Lactobacillus porci]|uniref:M24 family metallopeptidase n=1 Tax=Lactobacillus porci TaxID=2012477 RepID=UPI002A3366D2|nr:Xaa-Pro peptidase family protein [Lactobacillus porci]MDD6719805.1 Xaa-Pro peptidase family protein [Lactobacillus porci]
MSKNEELLSLLTRRIAKTTELIKEQDADALLVFNRANYRYLTNFTGEEAQLILTKDGDRILLSDSRFAPQIKSQAVGELTVIMKHGHEAAEIAEQIKATGAKKVLVEAEFVSAYEFAAIKELLPEVDLVMAAEIVERVRNVKDDLELATLRKAVEISQIAFEGILPLIKPGAKERDVGAKLDYLFKLNGGDGPGYDSIVASGYRSSWAHGVASDKLMQEHELVVIDAAAAYNGYTADITRTYAIGSVSPELEKIYKIVHEAQRRGIAAAKAGNTGKDVDQAARSYINEQGYGQYFGHGIGHGIGLEIHEMCQPAFLFRDTTLENGIVHTVEPGIYLPEGGVRIEDDILVNGDTPEVLTTLPKDELIHL